jgi:hypothetical protein
VRDLLPPLFQIGAGVGFLLFLVTNLMTRSVLRDLQSKLFGGAMALIPFGFALISIGLAESSLGAAAPMLVAAGGAFLLSLLLIAAGLLGTARKVRTAGVS